MKILEILTESKKVGREFNHLEDLVFTDPENGAIRAVEILKDLEQGARDVAVKWDGYPTMYWGRDDEGNFVLTGKNGWGRNKSTSAEELADFINSTGKGEEWRERFAGDMAALFSLFERATPKDFRGYVYADILVHPGAPATSSQDAIQFTPNKTTYTVKKDSELGQAISGKQAVVAATQFFDEFGSKQGKPFDNQGIFKGDVVVLGQTYIDHRPAVDVDNLSEIEKLAKTVQSKINSYFAPRKGLADIQEIFYRYVNYMGKQRRLDDLSAKTFFEFVKSESSRISAPKQQRIMDLADEFNSLTDVIISLVKRLMLAKDEVIQELDAAEGDVTANIGDEKGGEGYVKHGEKVKLVPRKRFTLN